MSIGTPLTNQSTEMRADRKAYVDKLEEIKSIHKSVYIQKNDNTEKHKSRGKLLARERINLLIDKGSFFLEIGTIAGANMYEGTPPGAGVITGIGVVNGRECLIVANDATVKGGCYFPMTVKKHLRAQEIAKENKLPCLYLVDSGGAFLPMQDEVFPDKEHFGRIFYNQACMSAEGIPQIAAVMGSCTAGGAYVPAMCDESIIVKGTGTIFLGGPPLVKAATGQDVTAEELGGADLHAKDSGVVDYSVDSDEEAIFTLRKIVSNLGIRQTKILDRIPPVLPLYPEDDIYSLIPRDSKKNIPIREILARILDNSQLDEFKADYGKTIICGFARIDGYLTGIIANDGILFSESALKAAHFIQLCDRRSIPLVFFQNISGFMVGTEYEKGGIAKNGAKMVTAVASTSVPKFTIIIGGSFGAGNYAMCGRAYSPRFLFSWPNSRTSVMGPEQAASVLTQIKRDAAASANKTGANKKIDEASLTKYQQEIENEYKQKSNSIYASSRLWDDGIIDPVDTRAVLSNCFRICSNSSWEPVNFGVFRM